MGKGADVGNLAASTLFVLGVALSLSASWVLVARIERVGRRFGISDALLGLLAALAGDGPELTSAVTALVHHQRLVGAGVVLGSNVFNLAALLGLGAVVAGSVVLHRSVVELSGAVALAVGLVCLLSVVGALQAATALVLSAAIVLPYGYVLGAGAPRLRRPPLPGPVGRWLGRAVAEEDAEAQEGFHLPRHGRRDVPVAALALAVVVIASVEMERAASVLGRRLAVPDIVLGGIVLAAVTSVPNAVAAVYLARRRRGTAVLSTALNSNTVNALAGFLLPAAVVGTVRSGQGSFVAAWYAGLTAASLALAWGHRGIRRGWGAGIICAYAVFVASLALVSSR